MVAGYTPNQGYIAMQSQQLAEADFTETGQGAGEDHAAPCGREDVRQLRRANQREAACPPPRRLRLGARRLPVTGWPGWLG